MDDSTGGRRGGRDPFVLLALLALPAWCLGPPPGPAAEQGQPGPQPPRREAAGELFRQRCARCHGADGTGQPKRARGAEIPNFTDRTWQASRTDDKLLDSILNGRGRGMPAFRDRISADQARDLVAHVRAFGESQAAPAAAATAGHPGAGRDERGPADARADFPGKLADWLAKFHPPAVSFPVALLVAAAVAELLFVLTGRPLFDAAARFCVWFGALATLPAAALGWCCGGFRLEDSDWVLATHRWLGTSTALGALVVLALSEAARRPGGRARPWFRAAVFAAAGLVLVTGFFGGAVANGLAHYAWPR